MRDVNYNVEIQAEEPVWEFIDTNERFNTFVGQCTSHFLHFVIPYRDQSKRIVEYYRIPDDIPDTLSAELEFVREDSRNIIEIYYRYFY